MLCRSFEERMWLPIKVGFSGKRIKLLYLGRRLKFRVKIESGNWQKLHRHI